MDIITDAILQQFLNSLDPTPVNPTREQKYLAFLVCKNLTDLCETGSAILNHIQSSGGGSSDLPEKKTINLCKTLLQVFYSNEMFIEDEEFGSLPNWSVVESFTKTKSHAAYKIYRAIRKNVIDKPDSKEVQRAVISGNIIYFQQNFDKIFADIPFKNSLGPFKNFVSSPDVRPQDQQYVMDFFRSLLDIFMDEAELLQDLLKM
jgi:hypothetical protein